MPKQIKPGVKIYVAVEMLGHICNGEFIVTDERNDQELNPRNIDDKIKIYRREVEEWFLLPAKKLLEENNFNNAFIVLMVCMSYLEGVQQYKTGISSSTARGYSERYFKDSIRRLYPGQFDNNGHLIKLYDQARCGLFHDGMVRGSVRFKNDYPEAIKFKNNGKIIEINPTKLLNDIVDDFKKYINELEDINNDKSETARENFDKMYKLLEE
ncbi:hypothetical protein VB620_05295 [Nodularia harveyana UHCC-0300]|uniref:Uncharacterized protein n=1 Tax=Nodularia harveyana UHCC-0300 TaxID=2974287 RepID=A0ABU5UE70_9CYAN|nr:hypothetical protein [Nodularia harveyana]MEA5580756.1 hypothetical protein [Nodularia harveyana UHCC-0300]